MDEPQHERDDESLEAAPPSHSGETSGDADDASADAPAGSGTLRRVVRAAVVVLAAFAVGYLIQFREARSARQGAQELQAQLAEAELDLEIEVLGHTLAGAALYAAHGDYRVAREEAIKFFDGLPYLRMRLSAERAEALTALASRRDDITGVLAAGESFAVFQVSDVFSTFNRELTGREYRFTVPAGLPR